jgi:hypothetical protein
VHQQKLWRDSSLQLESDMRKTWTIGAVALLAGILMMPNYQAVARGGGGGFHGGGGGFHGGFGGGGFRGGGFGGFRGGGFGGFRGGGFGRFGGFRGGFGRFGGGRFGSGFGFYGGYGSGYGYYDPSTVMPDEQLTYPAPVVPSPPAPDAKVVSNPYSRVPSEEPDLLRPGELLVRFPPPKKISR